MLEQLLHGPDKLSILLGLYYFAQLTCETFLVRVVGAEARSVSLDALWLDWEPWARTRGELRYVHSRKMLSKRLQSRGFSKEYSMRGTVFVGLNLRNTSISEA